MSKKIEKILGTNNQLKQTLEEQHRAKLSKFTELHRVAIEILGKEDTPQNWKQLSEPIKEKIMNGFATDLDIFEVAKLRGNQHEYIRFTNLLTQCESIAEKNKKLVPFLEYDELQNSYNFKKTYNKYLDDLSAIKVNGKTAVNLAERIELFISEYNELSEFKNNMVAHLPAELSRALPLVSMGSDFKLRPNPNLIQNAADIKDGKKVRTY